MLAVGRRHGVVQLDHLLHARPLPAHGPHARIVEEEVPPEVAVGGLAHVHPVIVVLETRGVRVLLRAGDEPVVAPRFRTRFRARPGERRVEPSHPDAGMAGTPGHRILDVVTHVQRVIDPRIQLLVQVPAVARAASDPADVQRARAGTAEGDVAAERHHRGVADVRPALEQGRHAAFVEAFDEEHVRIRLDARVTGIAGGKVHSARRALRPGVRRCRPRLVQEGCRRQHRHDAERGERAPYPVHRAALGTARPAVHDSKAASEMPAGTLTRRNRQGSALLRFRPSSRVSAAR